MRDSRIQTDIHKETLIQLANWVCGESQRVKSVVDHQSRNVIAASPELGLLHDVLPAPWELVLTAEAIEIIQRGQNAELRWPFLSVSPSGDGDCAYETISGSLGVLVDRSNPPHASGLPQESSERDALTGLLPRQALLPLLREKLAQFRALGDAFAVFFIDFDDLKQINDIHGHLAGDEVLRTVAARLLHTIRPDDRAVRFGGDEFIILLSRLHTASEAIPIARRLADVASRPIPWRDATLDCTTSIGIAFVRHEDQSPETLLDRADQAMYRAKNLGRCGKIELD